MAGSPVAESRRVEAAPVVHNRNRQNAPARLDLHLNAPRMPVPYRVVEGLAYDQKKMVLPLLIHHRGGAGGFAGDRDAGLAADLPGNLGEVRANSTRSLRLLPKVPHGSARVFDGGSNQVARVFEKFLPHLRRGVSHAQRRFQKHRRAGAALDYRVMHLARQAAAFLEYAREPLVSLSHAQLVNAPNRAHDDGGAQQEEPMSLVIVRPPLDGRSEEHTS